VFFSKFCMLFKHKKFFYTDLMKSHKEIKDLQTMQRRKLFIFPGLRCIMLKNRIWGVIRVDFTEKTIESETVYEGRIIKVRSDRVTLVNGDVSSREVVEHAGGVAVLPMFEDGTVLMVRQYRYPMERSLLELPAGKLEKGEDPLQCAVRELSEETGCTAEEFVYLGEIYPSPGYCKEILYIYLARGLKNGKPHPDKDEFLSVEKYDIRELVEMIGRNELCDAKTVVGILKTMDYLGERYGQNDTYRR